MNKKENILLKRNLSIFILTIIIFIIISFIFIKLSGNNYIGYLRENYINRQEEIIKPSQIRIEFDDNDIVKLDYIKEKDNTIIFSLSPKNKGKTIMFVYNNDTNDIIYEDSFRVLPFGIIVSFSTGNFTNYRICQLFITLLCIVLSIMFWLYFVNIHRKIRYSYQAIFYSGFAIWISLVSILMIRVLLQNTTMFNVYMVFKMAALEFMIFSFPLILIFCIMISVSNIQLIKREGFKLQNVLGIVLSISIIFGLIISFVLTESFSSGSEKMVRVFGAITSISSSFYAFFECFLIGSILCGLLAANHEPDYDKDFIVILGCQIKSNGDLYPLIRERVNRAIEFYYKQIEKTGKKAILLPSGGQGSDEPMSEAEAMKRYLLEKGILEEQIMVENKSKNTIQNMCFSKKIIDKINPNSKVVFSTTNYHVFRSGIISRQNQFEPDGMGSKTKWYFWPNAYIREVIGMLVYRWKSILIILIPIVIFLIAIQFIG